MNESGFNVFTDNKRSVLYMTHLQSGAPIAFVAIGAMLVRFTFSRFTQCRSQPSLAQVGSILWTAGGQKGTTVKRGEELGYFAYGGSTIVALFPKSLIQYCVSLL